MTPITYIGIDPDVSASGVAEWHRPTRQVIQVQALSFFALFDYLRTFDIDKTVVYVEAGFLNRSYRHNIQKNNIPKTIAAIGGAVGRNHETGHKIIEMCAYLGLTCIPVRPRSRKWTSTICKQITGIDIRHQDKIDALKLVYGR